MNFITSLINVALLIALAAPGYILRKLKMVPENFVGGLVALLLYVCSPFLTIDSFILTPPSNRLYLDMGIVLLLGFVMLIGALLISMLCFSWKKDSSQRKVCIASGFLNNSGFMGVPVLQAFYPGNAEIIVYVSMYIVAFNIISWTLLVTTITGDRKYMRLKAALINPGTISFLIGLAAMLSPIPLPLVIRKASHYLAETTTPVSMLVIGTRLADIKIRDLVRSVSVFLSSFVKLIIVPLCTLGFLLLIKPFLPASQMVYNTMFILSAMPSATYVIAFCEKFNADKDAAVKCVVLSSLLCVITIPVMMLFINLIE